MRYFTDCLSRFEYSCHQLTESLGLQNFNFAGSDFMMRLRAGGALMLKNWLALCIVTLFLWSAAVDAKRVALVVGNANYEKTGSLSNPSSDALSVAQSAQKAGFDEVIVARALNMQAFHGKLREFREKATGADLAMVYYAGHGVESRGKNWLIPVDAKLQTSLDLPYEAINLDRILEALEGSEIGMVVLDACRNNPFGDT